MWQENIPDIKAFGGAAVIINSPRAVAQTHQFGMKMKDQSGDSTC